MSDACFALAKGGSRTLFADKDKYTGGQRDKVEQENSWPDVQAEPQKAVDDQVNREQNHPDAFVEFHEADLLDRLPPLTIQI